MTSSPGRRDKRRQAVLCLSEGQLELSWSSRAAAPFINPVRGAIHAWLIPPCSTPSLILRHLIHFLTARFWDYEEKRGSSRRDDRSRGRQRLA